MPIVLRHHITPNDPPQNWRFDDFESHWIYNQLAPSARRIPAKNWRGAINKPPSISTF